MCKRFKYRVEQNDEINTLCKRFNTSKENIIRNNKEIPLYAGEWIEVIRNDYITHIVKPTETLEDLATTYNVSAESIKAKNGLDNEKLYIGQLIKIYN